MTDLTLDDRRTLEAAEARLRALLPEEYQETYDDVQPVSMGSAGLKYRADGQVAWDAMWQSFCDLAMAGGPPHKGTLLQPAPAADVFARPDAYRYVVDEICRGIVSVTGLAADPSPDPGWVRVECLGEGMAGWLARAIAMENIAVRLDGISLGLPAGPAYRLEKEIKNVITAIAKTCHYWEGHMSRTQQRTVTALLARMTDESPLLQPSDDGNGEAVRPLAESVAQRIGAATTLAVPERRYAGWLGVECASVRAAVWMMRMLVAGNVLSRREGTVLFVPLDPVRDPQGNRIVQELARVYRFAAFKDILRERPAGPTPASSTPSGS